MTAVRRGRLAIRLDGARATPRRRRPSPSQRASPGAHRRRACMRGSAGNSEAIRRISCAMASPRVRFRRRSSATAQPGARFRWRPGPRGGEASNSGGTRRGAGRDGRECGRGRRRGWPGDRDRSSRRSRWGSWRARVSPPVSEPAWSPLRVRRLWDAGRIPLDRWRPGSAGVITIHSLRRRRRVALTGQRGFRSVQAPPTEARRGAIRSRHRLRRRIWRRSDRS